MTLYVTLYQPSVAPVVQAVCRVVSSPFARSSRRMVGFCAAIAITALNFKQIKAIDDFDNKTGDVIDRQLILNGRRKQKNFVAPNGLKACHKSSKLLINIANYSILTHEIVIISLRLEQYLHALREAGLMHSQTGC